MSFFLLPLLWLAAATPAEVPETRAIAVFSDRSVRWLFPGEIEDAAALSGFVALWTWSDASPPRRLEADELPSRGLPESRERLRVRIAMKTETGEESPLPAGLAIRAAPTAMWREVPETSLPSWPFTKSAEIAIPHDPEKAWRIRLVGPGHGSWWVDLRPGQHRVDLVPIPAATRSVSAVDRNGAVLPGATFAVMDASLDRRQEQRTLARFAANEDGEVRIESLPDAASLLWVVTEPSHSPAGFRSRPSSLPSRIVLEPGATVRGVFTDPRGAAIPGVRVAR